MTLKRVVKLADSQMALETQVKSQEEELKKTKAKLREVSEVLLPEAMDEMEVSELTIRDQLEVAIKEQMYASLPKKNLDAIADWLRGVKADSLIKREVGVEFVKGQDNMAGDLLGTLREQYPDNTFNKVSINTGSVKSLAKEMLGDGRAVPLALLGINTVRRAVLTSSGKEEK